MISPFVLLPHARREGTTAWPPFIPSAPPARDFSYQVERPDASVLAAEMSEGALVEHAPNAAARRGGGVA